MRIAIYAFDDITMFHLAAPLMVFGEVRRLGLADDWHTQLWSDSPGTIRTVEGYPIGDIAGPSALDRADIVVVPSWPVTLPRIDDQFRRMLRAAHSRGATVVGLCLGAFAVADTGLLHGRAAVTHWEMMPELAVREPNSAQDASVLFIDHGDVMTSAGTASAIDACLHLVRRHLGSATAARIARGLVVAPHRDGGQAQYIERPLPREATDTTIAQVQQWALDNLRETLTVDVLARRANMSRRSFVRQFQTATGATPARWVLQQRLDESRVLLETTDWGIDDIAAASGFRSVVTFRQNFISAYATPPTTYRRQFANTGA